MTVKQAAKLWGISRYQVNAYIKQKRVEAVKHGRDWWITDGAPKPSPKPWSGGRPKKQTKEN